MYIPMDDYLTKLLIADQLSRILISYTRLKSRVLKSMSLNWKSVNVILFNKKILSDPSSIEVKIKANKKW